MLSEIIYGYDVWKSIRIRPNEAIFLFFFFEKMAFLKWKMEQVNIYLIQFFNFLKKDFVVLGQRKACGS